jgi:hypothetical protein
MLDYDRLSFVAESGDSPGRAGRISSLPFTGSAVSSMR